VWLEGLGKLEKFNNFGTRTHYLQACSTMPQPTTLPHVNPNATKAESVDSFQFLFLMNIVIAE
jgi:hypothetical protein